MPGCPSSLDSRHWTRHWTRAYFYDHPGLQGKAPEAYADRRFDKPKVYCMKCFDKKVGELIADANGSRSMDDITRVVWESDGWHPSRPGPLCQHLMQCDGQPGTVKERARDEHEERNTKRCEARRLHKNGGQRPSGGTGARYAPHAPQNRGQQTHHDSLAGFHTSGGSTVTSAVPHLSPYMFSPIRASEAASVLPYVPEYGMAQYSGESWAYLGRTQYSGNYNEPIVDTGYAVMSQVAGQNREPPPPSNPGQHAEYGLATGSHMIQESIAVPTATCCGPQSTWFVGGFAIPSYGHPLAQPSGGFTLDSSGIQQNDHDMGHITGGTYDAVYTPQPFAPLGDLDSNNRVQYGTSWGEDDGTAYEDNKVYSTSVHELDNTSGCAGMW